MVDFFLVLMLAGAGDEIQGIKKGISEFADAIAINKADGDNALKAERAKKDYETALHLLGSFSPVWKPPVLTCSALETRGIDKIWETVLEHRRLFESSGELEAKRRSQAVEWMESLLEDGLKQRFYNNNDVKNILPKIKRDVEKGITAPAKAARMLLGFEKCLK
jgi:LAO/AO transport system kinase